MINLEAIKTLVFGFSVRPVISESTILAVVFWPDGFLLVSFILSVFLVGLLFLLSKKNVILDFKSNLISVSAIYISMLFCFLILIGAMSATLRIFMFIFGGGGESYGNQSAVIIFSGILLFPTLFSVSIVVGCGKLIYLLNSLRLRE